jgi:hypothetical protein
VKQARAAEWVAHLWRDRLGRTSLQVLSEYSVCLTRKLTPHVPPDEAWEDTRTLFGEPAAAYGASRPTARSRHRPRGRPKR